MRRFLNNLTTSDVTLDTLTVADLNRVVEILTKYADSQLDFVDATLVAIAKRLNITRILSSGLYPYSPQTPFPF